MHVVLWRYRVRAGREPEFEAAYGDKGSWTLFFAGAEGFLGTELMRGSDGTYLTVDRWASAEAFREFHEIHAARYAELDAACSVLTLEEAPLGSVEA